MLTAMISFSLLAGGFGLVLGIGARRLKVATDPVVDQIDAILPQTQCGQCGFAGCKPYATAIANGEVDINQCPPGGETVIQSLAQLLNRDVKPLNSEHGSHRNEKLVALIDETKCIGCTLCIQACPVDAILGAAKQMHSIIAAECTGCELCLPPCPVDCIAMVPLNKTLRTWKWPLPTENTRAQIH